MWFFCFEILIITIRCIAIYWAFRKTLRYLKNLFRKFNCKMTSNNWNIYEINDEWECKQACKMLKEKCQNLSVLGFDCEWTSNALGYPNRVALLQLASTGGICGLFRLNKLKKIPNELKQILCDGNIIKMGVTPLDDAKRLLQDYNIQVEGTLDLRFLYPEATGLASLASSVLGVTLDKSRQISCSDWEQSELTQQQIKYAAQDAYIAVEIFNQWLSSEGYYFVKDNALKQPIPLKIFSYLNKYFHVKMKIRTNEGYINPNEKNKKMVWGIRKSPLYDNCFMNAPDGKLLCSCNKRKAEWYVNRGLAKVVLNEPYTIQLLFEPAARGDKSSDGEFYRQLKQNQCVVCGNKESCLKHYVVPREYRKHFPRNMKDHQSHDIVLLCPQCHYEAGRSIETFKRKLAVICDAPIHRKKDQKSKDIKKYKNYVKALLAGDLNIPTERRIELENKIKKFYKIEEINSSIWDTVMAMERKTAKNNEDSHGIKVVNFFKTRGALQLFELLWRELFLLGMNPKFLPTYWSATHNH